MVIMNSHMHQYLIMNRRDARRATFEAEAPFTAIISVTDTGDEKNKFYPQSWLKAVLELQFLDVEEGDAGCITKEQAKEIARFAFKMYENVERFIVHCEYGQSRSAGIAAAICRHFEGHDNGIFDDKEYYPNRTCYYYVLTALKKRRYGLFWRKCKCSIKA